MESTTMFHLVYGTTILLQAIIILHLFRIQKYIPIPRFSLSAIKYFLRLSRDTLQDWTMPKHESIQIFPMDRKALIITSKMVRTGLLLCIGTDKDFDMYQVEHVDSMYPKVYESEALSDIKVYTVSVEPRGRVHRKKKMKITLNV